MSFSLSATGKARHVIRQFAADAAAANLPQSLTDTINEQLGELPAESDVSLLTYGHVGRGAAETRGEISAHLTITFTTPDHPEHSSQAVDSAPSGA